MSEDDDGPEMERFARQGLGIREVLQGVEGVLIDAGYDDFVIATDHGTFRWTLAPKPAADRPRNRKGRTSGTAQGRGHATAINLA
jgi:hypothetical protein